MKGSQSNWLVTNFEYCSFIGVCHRFQLNNFKTHFDCWTENAILRYFMLLARNCKNTSITNNHVIVKGFFLFTSNIHLLFQCNCCNFEMCYFRNIYLKLYKFENTMFSIHWENISICHAFGTIHSNAKMTNQIWTIKSNFSA